MDNSGPRPPPNGSLESCVPIPPESRRVETTRSGTPIPSIPDDNAEYRIVAMRALLNISNAAPKLLGDLDAIIEQADMRSAFHGLPERRHRPESVARPAAAGTSSSRMGDEATQREPSSPQSPSPPAIVVRTPTPDPLGTFDDDTESASGSSSTIKPSTFVSAAAAAALKQPIPGHTQLQGNTSERVQNIYRQLQELMLPLPPRPFSAQGSSYEPLHQEATTTRWTLAPPDEEHQRSRSALAYLEALGARGKSPSRAKWDDDTYQKKSEHLVFELRRFSSSRRAILNRAMISYKVDRLHKYAGFEQGTVSSTTPRNNFELSRSPGAMSESTLLAFQTTGGKGFSGPVPIYLASLDDDMSFISETARSSMYTLLCKQEVCNKLDGIRRRLAVACKIADEEIERLERREPATVMAESTASRPISREEAWDPTRLDPPEMPITPQLESYAYDPRTPSLPLLARISGPESVSQPVAVARTNVNTNTSDCASTKAGTSVRGLASRKNRPTHIDLPSHERLGDGSRIILSPLPSHYQGDLNSARINDGGQDHVPLSSASQDQLSSTQARLRDIYAQRYGQMAIAKFDSVVYAKSTRRDPQKEQTSEGVHGRWPSVATFPEPVSPRPSRRRQSLTDQTDRASLDLARMWASSGQAERQTTSVVDRMEAMVERIEALNQTGSTGRGVSDGQSRDLGTGINFQMTAPDEPAVRQHDDIVCFGQHDVAVVPVAGSDSGIIVGTLGLNAAPVRENAEQVGGESSDAETATPRLDVLTDG